MLHFRLALMSLLHLFQITRLDIPSSNLHQKGRTSSKHYLFHKNFSLAATLTPGWFRDTSNLICSLQIWYGLIIPLLLLPFLLLLDLQSWQDTNCIFPQQHIQSPISRFPKQLRIYSPLLLLAAFVSPGVLQPSILLASTPALTLIPIWFVISQDWVQVSELLRWHVRFFIIWPLIISQASSCKTPFLGPSPYSWPWCSLSGLILPIISNQLYPIHAFRISSGVTSSVDPFLTFSRLLGALLCLPIVFCTWSVSVL